MSSFRSLLLRRAAVLLTLGVAAFTVTTQAALVKKTVPYTLDGVTMQGYLVYDDATTGKRPGVLVIHEWWGLNDYSRMRADQLAEMGYVAFAADMYGDGVTTAEFKEAAALSSKVRGTPLMPARAKAALAVLAEQPQTDTAKLAAIGFCFGGTGVLELAYAGADVKGIVAFHGGLIDLPKEQAAAVKARMLILHGADDTYVPPAAVDSFQASLRGTGIDWQFIAYANAVHAFTNPAAGDDNSKGIAYNEAAARRSWAAMQVFFDELFAAE